MRWSICIMTSWPNAVNSCNNSVLWSALVAPVDRLEYPEDAEETDQDRFHEERGVVVDPAREEVEVVAAFDDNRRQHHRRRNESVEPHPSRLGRIFAAGLLDCRGHHGKDDEGNGDVCRPAVHVVV